MPYSPGAVRKVERGRTREPNSIGFGLIRSFRSLVEQQALGCGGSAMVLHVRYEVKHTWVVQDLDDKTALLYLGRTSGGVIGLFAPYHATSRHDEGGALAEDIRRRSVLLLSFSKIFQEALLMLRSLLDLENLSALGNIVRLQRSFYFPLKF